MARFVTGLIAWFGLGVIITEILNKFNLFDFRVKVYFIALLIVIIFLIIQLMLKHFESQANSSLNAEFKYKKFRTIYDLIVGVIAFCFLASIPFLRWGVIKRSAMLANEGKKAF